MSNEANKYVDKIANMTILGHLLQNPRILEDVDDFTITQNDFTDRLHRISFVSINNLYAQGLEKIDNIDIYNYIQNAMPEEKKYFEDKNGQDFLNKCKFISSEKKFDYYYQKMKKFTLLRTYVKFGVDIKDLYNPDIIDFEKKAYQENWLENHSIEDIIETIDNKIEKIKDDFKFEGNIKSEKIGNDIFETLERLKETPSIGLPLPFGIYNTIVAGARLKKVYLTSAPSGKGKSRFMLGSAVYLSCGEYYSSETEEWEKLSWKEPTLFISTELEKEEIQTMALAFISNVNEAKILGRESLTFDEQKRVYHAAEILKESELYIDIIPDFSVEDIERSIRANIEKKNVKYVFYDYIHSSVKLLAEISMATHGMKLREDNVLFMLSVKLKDLANKYGVFIQTGTQVNRSGINTNEEASSNMLRGASSIGDKMDFCELLLSLSENDKEAYKRLKANVPTNYEPNMVRNVYKNRGNRYNNCKIWCYADLGTCRILPIFCTTNDYEILDVPIFNIRVKEEE